jgi:hypothetical protein
MSDDQIHYVYIYLDPRKPGNYTYEKYNFEYEPFYVGKGKESRYKQHLKESLLKNDGNRLKANKIKKIQRLGYEIPILKFKEDISEDESITLEIELIKTIGRIDKKTGPLTNLTDGGEGRSGHIPSEETKEKLRQKHLGLKASDETKAKMSAFQRDRYDSMSEEEKDRLIEKWTASFTPERRKEISERVMGENNPNFGNEWNDEQRQKASVYFKVHSNFVTNNPQKINPNRGDKVGNNKYLYCLYDLNGKIEFKSYSLSEIMEQYPQMIRGMIRRSFVRGNVYKSYYIISYDKTDLSNVVDQISDENILKKLRRYKQLKENDIEGCKINNYYKYFIRKDGLVIKEGFSIKQLCEELDEDCDRFRRFKNGDIKVVDEYVVERVKYK